MDESLINNPVHVRVNSDYAQSYFDWLPGERDGQDEALHIPTAREMRGSLVDQILSGL
jgi:hypothetical protein